MKTVIVKYTVTNLAQWRSSQQELYDLLVSNGVSSIRTFSDPNDVNAIYHIFEVDDFDKLKNWIETEAQSDLENKPLSDLQVIARELEDIRTFETDLYQIRKDGLLKEFDFVESMIPLYRRFQMQLLQYSFIVYTAVLGLFTASLKLGNQQNQFENIILNTITLLPFLIAILLLVFWTTEIRIRRAILHISNVIAPKMKDLSGGLDILTWETSPGTQLKLLEKLLSASVSLILALSLPSLCGSVLYLFFAGNATKVVPDYIVWIGLVLLGSFTIFTSWSSIKHEVR